MGSAYSTSKPAMTNTVEPIDEKKQYLADQKAAAQRVRSASLDADTDAVPELTADVCNKWDKDLEQVSCSTWGFS